MICNTVGASFAILMSKYFLPDVFVPGTFLGNTLAKVKESTKIDHMKQEDKFSLIMYLVIMRVFPGSPNWTMNLVFPHLGIEVLWMSFSIFIGLMPWNYIACAAGSKIATFKDKSDIMNWETYGILLGITAFYGLIAVGKKVMDKKIQGFGSEKKRVE